MKGMGLTYKFFENNLVVIGTVTYIASQANITGRVVSAEGEPLGGLSVTVKGNAGGTSTDGDGRFSISVAEGATLVFSSVGYLPAERNVKGLTTLNIVLQKRNSDMDQVVVVGYGTQRKREITGAVGSIKASEIKDLQINSVNQALQGKVAGVQVTNNTGAPGSFVQIRICGTNSISSSNEPLYIGMACPSTIL